MYEGSDAPRTRKGLRKAKQYDWKDSNMALFGSDTEKQVKKSAAETEPAWQGLGNEVSLKIWRIVKFKVVAWPEEEYGSFFSGDSYIILNTYKPNPDSEELAFDVHFWIGRYSTQDEYGAAAYKTVELDTFLDDRAVQHREVQGHESELFQSYFDEMVIMEGGAETGFRHVKPEEYEPRLLHFHGKGRKVQVYEKTPIKANINSGDVFILDMGLELYQYNGKDASKDEKFKAMQFMQKIRSERNGRPKTEVLDEESTESTHDFYKALEEEEEDDLDSGIEEDVGGQRNLYVLSDASGELELQLKAEGTFTKADLSSDDVNFIDTGKELYVYVGSGASAEEKRNGLPRAHEYLKKSGRFSAGITVLSEGRYSSGFEAVFAEAA